jgi:hypothetical protein
MNNKDQMHISRNENLVRIVEAAEEVRLAYYELKIGLMTACGTRGNPFELVLSNNWFDRLPPKLSQNADLRSAFQVLQAAVVKLEKHSDKGVSLFGIEAWNDFSEKVQR